jgi:exodeoxyribonuclease-3
MKIATYNVNGVNGRLAVLRRWLAEAQPDIVCLQELKATSEQVPAALCEMEGYWCYWHGARAYSGVALHVSKSFAPERPLFSHPPFDFETRIATVDVATASGPLTVASVYVPNGGKDFRAKMAFLEAMDAFAASYQSSGRRLALLGDLNVARSDRDVHPKERKPRAIGQLPEERAIIERILSRGLVDVGRTLDPDNDGLFTWWAPWRNMRERNIGWRLDYIAASRALVDETLVVKHHRDVGSSDHGPVIAHLRDTPRA